MGNGDPLLTSVRTQWHVEKYSSNRHINLIFTQGRNMLPTTNLNGEIIYYVLVVLDLRGIIDGFILTMT